MKRSLAITFLLGLGAGTAYADDPTCPAAIPTPATAHDCFCKTLGRDKSQRCASPLAPDQCASLTADAFARGLLTADGRDYLVANGFCPVFVAGVTGILDFCPVGCFAADTEVLTGPGGASYAEAAQIMPRDPVATLSDETSVDALDLASHQVQRVVYGPEEPALFVFGLASGATLRVTMHHPMVLDTGAIVEAAAVPTGASFISSDGQSVPVTSITREPATADVFNFQTDSETQLGHVIIASNVLVGDLKLQNELAAEQSSISLRQ